MIEVKSIISKTLPISSTSESYYAWEKTAVFENQSFSSWLFFECYPKCKSLHIFRTISPLHSLLLKFIYEHTIHKHNLSRGVNCKIMHFVSFCSQHNETHLQWEANLLDWELKYWFPPRWGQWNRGARNSCANALHLKWAASWIIEETWQQNLSGNVEG